MYEGIERTRKDLWSGEWDAYVDPFSLSNPSRTLIHINNPIYSSRLVISSEYEPAGIINRLTPFLAGSAQLVVYHPILEVLSHPPTT
jgi:hypothetical protein